MTVVRRSSRARRVGMQLVVCLVACAGASFARAQTEDRPVISRGRAIGIEKKDTDDAKPVEKRVVTPDGKTTPGSAAPTTTASALIFTIDVRWLGATSYRIERDVTQPIERAVKTLPGVKEVRSSSTGSRAQTLVYFSTKEDASTQAVAIRNRLDQIKSRLPHAASPPLIAWRREPPI